MKLWNRVLGDHDYNLEYFNDLLSKVTPGKKEIIVKEKSKHGWLIGLGVAALAAITGCVVYKLFFAKKDKYDDFYDDYEEFEDFDEDFDFDDDELEAYLAEKREEVEEKAAEFKEKAEELKEKVAEGVANAAEKVKDLAEEAK